MPDATTTVAELREAMRQFVTEREWEQFHNHKDVALSLVLEAAEVLEHFQWKTLQEVEKHVRDCKDELADELADVAIFLIYISCHFNIDLLEAISKKVDINAAKYPVTW